MLSRKRALTAGIIMFLSVIISTWYVIGCGSDFNTNPDINSIRQQASTTLPVPFDGSTPKDYSANENAYIAFTAISKEKSFVGQSSGEAITEVAFVSVHQKVKTNRVVNGNEIYKESISHSSFKGVGVRAYINGHNFVVRDASKVNSVNSVSWKSWASRVSEESYIARYGHFANSITAYVLTDETILSSEFLGEENGIFSYKYNLHPVKATGKISLEMRTMAGTASMPIFERVSLTIRMDKNWRVTETLTDCVYEVDMLGGVTCRENVKEVFSGYGQDNPIPDADFFKAYLDSDITEPLPEELTATDYVMNGFSEYITGQKPLIASLAVDSNAGLSLTADVKANIDLNNLNNLSILANVTDLSYDKFAFENLLVGYKNNSAFVSLGDFKATGTVEEITAIINKILPSFGKDGLDFSTLSNINTEDLLNNASLTKEDGVATVTIPLSLGDVTVNVELNFTDGDNITFIDATATIDGFNLSLVKNDALVIPELSDGYNNIAPLFDIIDDKGNIKLNVNVGDINALVNFNAVNLSADINFGDITAKYFDNNIYLNYEDIKAKLAISDIQPTLDKLAPVLNGRVDIPDLNAIFNSVDVMALVKGAVDTLTTTVGENSLTISTTVEGAKVDIVLSTLDNAFALSNIALTIEDTKIIVTPTNENISSIASEDLVNYCDITTLLNIIDQNNNVSFTAYALGLEIKATLNLVDLTLLAKIDDAELLVILTTGDVYARYSGARVKVNFNDLPYIIEQISPLIEKFGGAEILQKIPSFVQFSDIDANDVLSSIATTLTNDGLEITVNLNGLLITANLDTTNNDYSLKNIAIKVDETEINVMPSDSALDLTFDTGLDYVDLKEVVDTFSEPLSNVLLSNQMSVSIDGSFASGNTVYDITACNIKISGLNGAPKATANLTLDIIKTEKDGTTSTTTHTITLVYLDPSLVSDGDVNVYFTYDSSLDNTGGVMNPIKGTFTTTKVNETIDIIKEIYKNMPELQETLNPIIMPDKDGNPTLPDFDVDISSLINALAFASGTLTADIDGSVLLESLPKSIQASLNGENGAINLSIPALAFDGGEMNLSLCLAKPQEEYLDGDFTFTLDGSEKNFSSINELLKMLSNTAKSRSFDITGNIGMSIGTWNIAKDAIDVRAQLDVIDGKTYAVVTITRNPTSVIILGSVWKDYSGTSTIYLDPVENMIYTKRLSVTKKEEKVQTGTIMGFIPVYDTIVTYPETTEYKKFTVEQFTADLLPNLLYLLNLNSTIEKLIPTDSSNSSNSESRVSTATVENTLLGYSYNGVDTFNLKLNLAPLIGDVQNVNATIKHDENMNVSTLTATVLVVNAITINLDAKLNTPYDTYQNTKESLEVEKNSGKYV